MRRKKYFIIAFMAIFILGIPASYAIYQSSNDVSVQSTTGDIICHLSIDTDDSYIKNNEPYFLITVDNFETVGGVTSVSSVIVDYTITIENESGSQGLFRYIDEDGNTNSTGTEKAVIKKRIGNEKTSQKIKVFTTADTNLETDVKFKVKLDAVQADMS